MQVGDLHEGDVFVSRPFVVVQSHYATFCAARREFLSATIAWMKTDGASSDVVAQEVEASINALRAIPSCLGKDGAHGG